jgi:hypothetical protein
VEAWGQPWTPKRSRASYSLVRWPVLDEHGPANPSEKRKVGGSTPPLTTTSDLHKRALSGRLCAIRDACSLIPRPSAASGRPHSLHSRRSQARLSSAADLGSALAAGPAASIRQAGNHCGLTSGACCHRRCSVKGLGRRSLHQNDSVRGPLGRLRGWPARRFGVLGGQPENEGPDVLAGRRTVLPRLDRAACSRR